MKTEARSFSAQDSGRAMTPEHAAAVGQRAEPPTPDETRELVIEALKSIYDPEIPVNIYDLGLIYDIDLAKDGALAVRMTLTTPMCPVAESLPYEVELKLRSVPGVSSVELELVWDPPWTFDRMSEAARLQLNL